jgi:hypothetical protein
VKCANPKCGAELYAGCDYTYDRYDDEWYCDDSCYVERKRTAGDLMTEMKLFD